MLSDLRPMSLTDAARTLGVDPFEVVRLMVASRTPMDTLTLDPDQADALRESAGIECWWEESTLPDDANPLRAAVRGALHQLVSRRLIGEVTTRLDNLWRGLTLDQQVAIEQAVMVLLEEQKLLTAASPRGVQVSITPGSEGELEQVATGQTEHAGLGAVWASTAGRQG